MFQIGPREIGADLAFGVDLALFILQYSLANAKGEAPVDKLIIHFKQLTCNHCKEIL